MAAPHAQQDLMQRLRERADSKLCDKQRADQSSMLIKSSTLELTASSITPPLSA